MNANEIADELEIFNGLFVKPSEIVKDSIAMLRQLQAENEALRMMLANRNDALDKLDLKSTPCKYTEGM